MCAFCQFLCSVKYRLQAVTTDCRWSITYFSRTKPKTCRIRRNWSLTVELFGITLISYWLESLDGATHHNLEKRHWRHDSSDEQRWRRDVYAAVRLVAEGRRRTHWIRPFNNGVRTPNTRIFWAFLTPDNFDVLPFNWKRRSVYT